MCRQKLFITIITSSFWRIKLLDDNAPVQNVDTFSAYFERRLNYHIRSTVQPCILQFLVEFCYQESIEQMLI